MKKIWLTAVFSVSVYGYDGNELNRLINSQNTIEQAAAFGYITAVDDGHTITGNTGVFGGCFIPPISGDQKVAIVKKYLNSNPEKWHFNATILVQDALENAFPCKTRLNREESFRRQIDDIEKLRGCQKNLESCLASQSKKR